MPAQIPSVAAIFMREHRARYIVCMCIAHVVWRNCVSPQVLVDFHEGIVRRRARPLQSELIALEKLQAKGESSLARLDSRGRLSPHGSLFFVAYRAN